MKDHARLKAQLLFCTPLHLQLQQIQDGVSTSEKTIDYRKMV